MQKTDPFPKTARSFLRGIRVDSEEEFKDTIRWSYKLEDIDTRQSL